MADEEFRHRSLPRIVMLLFTVEDEFSL